MKASTRPPVAALARTQVAWLVALVLLAQAPHWTHLPGWIAMTGSALAAARFAVPANHRTSRWLLPLLAVVAAIGIRWQFGYFLAREPCVAFLYILVGVKLVEARGVRDGALLVCLSLFLALTQFFYTQSIFAALAALPALLTLGATLAALRDAPLAGADWKTPLAVTARMILQGIPLALLLFVLFPRLAGPLWGLPADNAAKSGLSDRMSPGSISELSLSDAVAFRVDFEGRPPPSAQRYWRGPVLSVFDGREWSPATRMRLGRFAPGRARQIGYTVTLEPHGKQWLFALELPTALPQPPEDSEPRKLPTANLALFTGDQQLIARSPVTQPLRYAQRSALRDAYPADDDERAENLRLPRNNNPKTVAFARELRGRTASDRAYAAAVLDWFRAEPFVYTLTAALLPTNEVDAFLFDTRRGFCEHFAGAFVVLLRAGGVPARVVTGYQGGEINPNGDYMIVRQSDAHAWAEALIDGAWQRFDPTATVAPSRIERGLGAALPLTEPVPYLARVEMTWLKSLRLHWDAVNYQWQRGVVGFNLERQREFLSELGLDGAQAWQIVAVIAVAAFVWGLALLGIVYALRARADPARALWTRACRRLARAGLQRRPDEGPLAYAERAGERWPQWRALFARIGESYAGLRYGPDEGRSDELVAELRASVAALPGVRALAAAAR